MKNKINRIVWTIFFFLLALVSCRIIYDKCYQEKGVIETKFYYFDNYIYIKVYSKEKEQVKHTLDKIEKMYRNYSKLLDSKTNYPNKKGAYYLAHQEGYQEVEDSFYQLIKKADEYQKNYPYFSILYEKEKQEGLLALEKKEVPIFPVKDVVPVIKEDKVHSDVYDFSNIILSYTTSIASSYLKEAGLFEYVIDAGGIIEVGRKYDEDLYQVAITNSKDKKYDILSLENKKVVTKGEEIIQIKDKTYHKLLNPQTLSFESEYLSVTTVCDNVIDCEVYATNIFHMKIKEALDFINEKEDVEAIFYTKDNIYKSNHMDEYLRS